jgi:hypothetical protein
MARGLVLSNDVSSHPCTIPRVKRRNLDRWIVLAAFGAQLFAPFAACAAVKPDVSLSDLCTASGKTLPASVVPASLPVQKADRHGSDHCTHCPGGSSPAATNSAALQPGQIEASGVALSHVEGIAPASRSLLLPPSRAPPATA